mgnify:CR=1 FL=1
MKERENILHVVRQFYPAIGGIENYVLNLAAFQVQQGYNVTVVTLNRNFTDDSKLTPAETILPGIKIVRIPFFFSKKYPVAFGVLRYLDEADIINVHAVDFFADFIALYRMIHRKKTILVTHGGFFHTKWGYRLKKIYFNTITRLLIKSFDAVIGCSENDITVFKPLVPSIKLIHNGVNVQPYIKTKKAFNRYELLYVGRIDTHKGVDKLVRFVSVLREKGLPVRLNIVGPDWKGLLPMLKELARNSGVEDHVTFKGPVSDGELRDIYASAHLFLSASEYEGFGISAVEAMASGTLCALHAIESFSRLLAEKSFGVICDFNDLSDTAERIIPLLELPDNEYYNLSEEARKYSESFSWEKTAGKINRIYEQV